MREYLFRGISKTKDTWIYGSYYSFHSLESKMGTSHFIIPYNTQTPKKITEKTLRFEVIPETIGQFTELDRKIVESNRAVFDGDIVLITDYTLQEFFKEDGEYVSRLVTREYEIVWNKSKWGVKPVESYNFFTPTVFDLPLDNVFYKVIGNIYNKGLE